MTRMLFSCLEDAPCACGHVSSDVREIQSSEKKPPSPVGTVSRSYITVGPDRINTERVCVCPSRSGGAGRNPCVRFGQPRIMARFLGVRVYSNLIWGREVTASMYADTPKNIARDRRKRSLHHSD